MAAVPAAAAEAPQVEDGNGLSTDEHAKRHEKSAFELRRSGQRCIYTGQDRIAEGVRCVEEGRRMIAEADKLVADEAEKQRKERQEAVLASKSSINEGAKNGDACRSPHRAHEGKMHPADGKEWQSGQQQCEYDVVSGQKVILYGGWAKAIVAEMKEEHKRMAQRSQRIAAGGECDHAHNIDMCAVSRQEDQWGNRYVCYDCGKRATAAAPHVFRSASEYETR